MLTATSVDGIDHVLLEQDGQQLEAPLPGGERTSAPVDAADYASLLADSTDHPEKAKPGPTTDMPAPGS